VRAKFAPNSDKKPAFLFEEATKFEKQYNEVFDTIVPYKMDSSWFSLLKDTIDRIQRLPRWEVVERDDNEGDDDEGVDSSPDLIRTTKVSVL